MTDCVVYRVQCPACHDNTAEVELAYPYTDTIRNHIPVITMFRCVHQDADWHVPPTDAELFDVVPDNAFVAGHRPAWWLWPSRR